MAKNIKGVSADVRREILASASAASSAILSLTGISSTVTFYASPTTGNVCNALNTLTIENGRITAWSQGSPSGGGSGGGNGTLATVDFGSGKGSTSATAAVTGQSWVSATSAIVVSVIGTRAEDAAIEGLTFAVGDLVDGVGFTVYASSPYGSVGTYTVACVGV